MLYGHLVLRAVLSAALFLPAAIFAQPRGSQGDGLSEGANLPANADITSGPTGISQATTLARPTDTLNTLSRDIGRLGNDIPSPPSTQANASEDATRTFARPRPTPKPESPTQFQRFVQEATGKLLPHFGTQLFESPQAYVPDPGLSVPANYVLGPGDEVRVQVWGAVDFSATLVLDRNGQVLIPKVGVVPLAGVSVKDLEPVLRTNLAKVFTNFKVNANLGRLRGIQVYVVGQASQPGTYVVSSLSTLVNALFMSGGPSANGSMRRIELQRAGKVVTRFDLYEFLSKGDKSQDASLLPGDVIFIPKAGPRVAVAGAYDQAAIYELKTDTDTVASILAIGGGLPATTNAQKAQLERINPTKLPAREVTELLLNPAGLQQTLRDGDVLTLRAISPAFVNSVTLQGVVAEPLRYPWFQGMRILDLIPDREALITPDYYKRKNLLVQSDPRKKDDSSLSTSSQSAGSRLSDRMRQMVDQINWDYAVIERLNQDTLTMDLIPFSLERAVVVRDTEQNIPLQQGDVITILSQNDLRLPQSRQSRMVRIEGEVASPGVYKVAPGENNPPKHKHRP
jgi:protein involved in polysaccharide export with SLBB domain